MKHEKRSKWSSQATFILAAIGSAVGLGNAWRFPGLAVNAGIKLNKLDTLPYYFFWMGQGKTAWQVSQDTTSAQQAAYSRFVTEYLRAALVQASDKAAAARKFGDVPEYQRLVPKRRR